MIPEASGLSPRVRGNQPAGEQDGLLLRSIPACAGEPGRSGCCQRRAWVYPRVCGGTDVPYDDVGQTEGLSPRVRGNLFQTRPHVRGYRSIPACAGEPPSRISTPPKPRVYPRVCGGTRK